MSIKSSIRSDHYELSTLSIMQHERNWRDVVFIPYKMWWKILVVITIQLNLNIVLYYLVFNKKRSSLSFAIPYYICETIYFVDVVLVIMYRCMGHHSRKQFHFSRHALLITIDVISILPVYELYYIIEHCSNGAEMDGSRDFMKLKTILRLQYVISFYKSIRNHPGANQVVVVICGQFYVLVLYVVVAASFWYLCSDDDDSIWKSNLGDIQLNRNNSLHWFIICISAVGNAYMHSAVGMISVTSKWEYLIITFTMFIGCLMHIMIFFGDLTAQHIQKFQHQLDFSKRLDIIIAMMRDWRTDRDSQKKTIAHYNKYWEMRQGMKTMPPFYWLLPLGMQKEISLDLFWDCFIHTQLFIDCETNFKRSLGNCMNTEFYLPGDYLFSAHQQKHKMAYLASGIVQILSQEDQESPVISFSSGTVFGEITTMLQLPSLINLRCATYCEIHTLDLRDLCLVMVQYKETAKLLHAKRAQRIQDAKTMQHPILLKMKDKQQKRTSIRWLKSQWRNIYRQSRKKTGDIREIPVTSCHTSNYLSMYALSGDVELKEHVICLKSSCPYVLEPTSSFRKFFEYIVVGVAVAQVLMVPYIVFFSSEMSDINAGLFYLMDFVYIVGLYLHMSTAVKTKDVILTEPKEIFIFRGKELSVIIDVLGILPFEIFGYMVGSPPHTCMLLHLNRILKIKKGLNLMKTAEKNLRSRAVRLRLMKFSLIFAYCVYSLGCVLYGVACPNRLCLPYAWFAYYENGTKVRQLAAVTNFERFEDFLVSITYSVGLILGLTDNCSYGNTITDIVLGFVTTFIGYCIFSFCFSELAACAIIQLQDDNNFREFLKVLKIFTANPDIPANLKANICDITICEWNYSRRHALTGQEGILRDAPDNLKKSILYQRIVDSLLKGPLFQNCHRAILWNLAPQAQLAILPPGTIISREDTIQKYLKLILRGYCRVETSIPTDNYRGNYSIYTTGTMFPLMEALLDVNAFLRVTCVTFVEVACIPFRSISSQLKNNDPDLYADLKVMLKSFLAEYDTILMRRKGRLPEMVSSTKSYGKGEYFQYDTNEQFDDSEKNVNHFADIGKWKFIERFFLKTTISPTRTFFLIWESVRCTISLINIVYTLTFLKYAMVVEADTYIQLFFLIICLIDFYIRIHCQYYNDEGIIVTHPWYTAKNYISGAFILDLYANVPIRFLGIHSMFHGELRRSLPITLLIATRPFQIYRVYCGIEYIRSRSKEEKGVLLGRIKYVMMTCVFFLTMGAILEHCTCSYDLENVDGHDVYKYKCGAKSWITLSRFGPNVSNVDMLIVSNYKILSLFTTCTVGMLSMRMFMEQLLGLTYIFLLFMVKWLLLAKIISAAIKGDTKLTQYQHDVNIMVAYLEKYLVDEALIKEAIDHYENLFNRSQGYDINKVIESFYGVLRGDVTFFMYWPVLQTVEFFNGSKENDMHYMCSQFTQHSYKKDAEIIRCNDVQEYCYVVYKGKVKISVAGAKLKILNPGGTFGCYQMEKTRQTITAMAMVHVELLCIRGKKLYEIGHRFPLVREKLRKAEYLKIEYTASIHMERNHETKTVQKSTYTKRWQRFLIDPESKGYTLYNYILCVHVSVLTSMLALVITTRNDIDDYFLYVIDLIFVSKIVVGFHSAYIDKETGILVKNFKSIAKKYVTEWLGFWFDLFTLFPFELLVDALTHNSTMSSCFTINRTFRFLHLVSYYNTCKNKLTVGKTLKWTFLIYMILIVIHFMAIIWWLISCPQDRCEYIRLIRPVELNLTSSNDSRLNLRITYMYVVSIFSSTGLRNQVPRTITELSATFCIVLVSQVVIYTLTSGFANILRLGKYVLNNYEKEINHLDIFMRNANLSLPIINKVRSYFIVLWHHYSGVCMPILISRAPGYLKQDIMFALYGDHITNHILFSKTHMDFIRQLLVHMVPEVYLPGQYVIEKGDIDGRMYFIHDGQVKILDKHGNNEIEQCVLSKGNSFGEYQALKNIEHIRSAKTAGICVIISLKTSDWSYLLDWFPASREILESKLNDTVTPGAATH